MSIKTQQEQNNDTALWGCLALIIGLFLVIPLIAMLAWNLGVVGVVAATGSSIAGINYWTALGVSAIYLMIRGVLKVIG